MPLSYVHFHNKKKYNLKKSDGYWKCLSKNIAVALNDVLVIKVINLRRSDTNQNKQI